MIPAPPGITARYRYEDNNGKPYYIHMRVIAFDDEGHGLVVDQDKEFDATRLVRADTWANYHGLGEGEEPQITSMIPAGGWRVRFKGDIDMPLAGWAVRDDGIVVPVFTSGEGIVVEVRDGDIYHPDAKAAD